MRIIISILLIGCSTLAACSNEPQQEVADIVLLNGGIYTVDAERSWAEAAAIRGGSIVAVGSNADIQAFVGETTEVIDLTGGMAMPGIHDSHVHPLEGGYEQVYCNLWDEDSVDAVIGRLQTCAATHEDEWFIAVGLNLGLFPITGPDKSILDGIADDKYIFVDGSDGHAALVNDRVLELLGIDENSIAENGGVIERRADSREPNGTLREASRDLADQVRPPRDHATNVSAMRGAIARMNSHGITSAYDVWVGEQEMKVYQEIEATGDLTMRVLGAIIDEGVFEKHSGADFERVLEGRSAYESDLVSYNSIKIMVDGVFEGETGAVLEPYDNDGHVGPSYHTADELNARVQRYYDMGMQLHFHTMGDRAVRSAMDAIEYARNNGSEEHKNLRHTVSHIGLVSGDDMHRFSELNIGGSVTMVWAYTDDWTLNLEIPAIGVERTADLYPIRTIDENGGVVLGGSDWNYGDLDPLLSIETGITRDYPFGDSSPGEFDIMGDEQVDLATMIDAYTINGAWQLGLEDVAGSIEAGKRADIVIYDRNLFEVDPYELSEALVQVTIFDGRVVYRHGDD